MSSCADVQFAVPCDDCPSQAQINEWVNKTLKRVGQKGKVAIRIVAESEITQLNHQYRHKDKPTNILSFPSQLPPALRHHALGDIVICATVVAHEAKTQHKTLDAHWAHMIVHGVLHLVGYDHEQDDEAHKMENVEIALLEDFGFANPYGENSSHER